jgi:hypothetical protein
MIILNQKSFPNGIQTKSKIHLINLKILRTHTITTSVFEGAIPLDLLEGHLKILRYYFNSISRLIQ